MKVVCFRCFVVFLFLLVSFFTQSFASEKARVTYEKDIKPVVSKRCVSCHGPDSPTLEEFRRDMERYVKEDKRPRIDTYEDIVIFINGIDMGSLTRRLDDGQNLEDGKPGNMYEYLGDTEEERKKNLQLFKDWIGGWDVRTRRTIKENMESEWLIKTLDGTEATFDEALIDKEAQTILDKIKVLRK